MALGAGLHGGRAVALSRPTALSMIFHGNPVRTAEEREVVQNISREELFRCPAEESSDS